MIYIGYCDGRICPLPELSQSNPFNPTAQICFDLSKQRYSCLKFYNIAGKLLMTLIDELEVT